MRNNIYNYGKILSLPSNGLSYNKFCLIKPFTNKTFFAFDDSSIIRNETEFITSILSEHVESDVNILEMYFYDVLFIWYYIYNSTFSITKLERQQECSSCGHSNYISIPTSSLDIKELPTGSPENIILERSIADITVYLEFSRRKTKHNIESSQRNIKYYFQMDNGQKLKGEEYTDFFLNLLTPQLISIKIKENDFGYISEYNEDKKTFLLDMAKYYTKGTNLVYEIYLELFDKVDFGIVNNMNFYCKKCNYPNKIKLINNLSSSMYDTKVIKKTKNNPMNYFSFVDTKLITFEELLNIPIFLNETIFNQITEILRKNAGKNYSTPEDMGIGIL